MKGLNYRPPFDASGEFPEWLNALRNQSGAYIIRSRRTRQILYVGESHTGNLAKTLKRHFYPWRDDPERKHNKRARLLPDGGSLTDESFEILARELSKIIDAARKISQLTRNEEARKLWHEVYPKLTGDRAGNFGAVTSRAEAHVLRLSILYALLDGKTQIELFQNDFIDAARRHIQRAGERIL